MSRTDQDFEEEDGLVYEGVYFGSRKEVCLVGTARQLGWAYHFVDIDVMSPIFTEDDKRGARLLTLGTKDKVRQFYRRAFADYQAAQEVFTGKCLPRFLRFINRYQESGMPRVEPELARLLFRMSCNEDRLIGGGPNWRSKRPIRRGACE